MPKHETPATPDFDLAPPQDNMPAFPDTSDFKERPVSLPFIMTVTQWRRALRQTEINDNSQKIKARPYLAWGVGLLLVAQNIGIWFIVMRALETQQLESLQIIFSVLIAGTLAQSYFLLKLITERVFRDINYHNGKV